MAGAGRLEYQSREEGGVLVVDLGGDLVMGEESIALRKFLRAQFDEKHTRVLLNLTNIRYMDSTGVGVVVEALAHAMAIGAHLRLCNVPAFTGKVLRQLNLYKILQVSETESEALAAFPT